MRWLAAFAFGSTVLISCGGDTSDAQRVIRVPTDAPTIQAGVDRARPGDLVLIAPGVYREAVSVRTERLTLRGEDRNAVVLDGQDTKINGISVEVDGVAVENLTIHGYRQSGLLFNGGTEPDGTVDPKVAYGTDGNVLSGYRASYVTSYNNGTYGIYAFASSNGTIEESYVSGNPDSGIYVGQCRPCNVVVRHVTAEHNAIGYYGTNASGGVYVVDSVFRGNRLGLTPNSQKMEQLSPQVETVLAGNLVLDNDDPDTPTIPRGFFGGGIAIGGGTRNIVVRNRVSGHDYFGIGLVSLNPFEPENNRVEGNVLADNGTDLVYLPSSAVTSTKGNCFVDNTFNSSAPDEIESAMPCDPGGDVAVSLRSAPQPAAPSGVDYRTMAAPPTQPGMPGDPTTAAAAPVAAPAVPDLAAITVPEAP